MSVLWPLAGSTVFIGFAQDAYSAPGVLVLAGTVYGCAGALAGWLVGL
ncbi:hypothetical protein [Streptomyces chrestomyceticus]|uniref:Uncharacterized protein n=1 Tax=Streptomyces chrestomyceticus TaxID=68185 RepID=A0ABU7X657_9ACTN